MRGEVATLDARVTGFQTKPVLSGAAGGRGVEGPGGRGASADVEAARLRGSGKVTYSSETGLDVDAKITDVDVRARSAKKPGNR